LDDGSIAERHHVWLSDWQLQNINSRHLLPIDLDVYQRLRTHTARALVLHLQIWLYASHPPPISGSVGSAQPARRSRAGWENLNMGSGVNATSHEPREPLPLDPPSLPPVQRRSQSGWSCGLPSSSLSDRARKGATRPASVPHNRASGERPMRQRRIARRLGIRPHHSGDRR
jgi:hypothetical protein